MPDAITEPGSATSSATANAGTEGGGETGKQETTNGSDVQVQLTAYQQQLQDLVAERTRLEAEANGHKQRAEDLDKSLRRLQQNTTAKLQQAAEQRRRLQQETELRAEITDLKMLVQRLASGQLDEQQIAQYELDRQRLALQTQQELLRQQAQGDFTGHIDMDAYKAQLLDEIAPDTSIKPEDPRIDWAQDAPDRSTWTVRVMNSLRRAEAQDRQNGVTNATTPQTPNDPQAVLQAQMEALQKDFQERVTKLAEEQRKTLEEERAVANRATEERLRAAGVDALDASARPESASNTTLMSRIETELDENLLRTPEGRAKWAERERAIKATLFKR